jgi:uncharacterized membrane protein
MSAHLPPDQPGPAPARQSGCAPFLLGLLGVVLLLPGICSVPVVLGMRELFTSRDAAWLIPLLIVVAILFVVGIRLIRKAFRTPAG